MCCLFGMLDYKHNLSKKQFNRITNILSSACEIRGKDATGIAYNYGGKMCIYKRPVPSHRLHLCVPQNVSAVMGHTRMTTQGDEKFNYNNHPFYGKADNTDFALAHNGVLYNDDMLKKSEHLPNTKIETDSYVAVQLIEKKHNLNFSSLRYMAENLLGSFTFTVLDSRNNLYIVKGDNPMCIYQYKELGVYLYASTEDILKSAVQRLPYNLGKAEKLDIRCGEILKIDANGVHTRDCFNDINLIAISFRPYMFDDDIRTLGGEKSTAVIEDLKAFASSYGYSPEYIEYLIDEGYTTDDIEEIIYCGAY